MRLGRVLGIYAVGLAAVAWSLRDADAPAEQGLPALPVEAELISAGAQDDFCGSDFLLSSLAAQTFRWVHRGAQPLWKRRLAVHCEQIPGGLVRVGVFAGDEPVFRTTYERRRGFDGDNVTARVIARLLSVQRAVVIAANEAYLANQADVARAGADLWRAGRWKQASESLWLALENKWTPESQADLHFGLADSYAHLGKPRQAFWHALAYLKNSPKPPPEDWLKRLRGVAGLLARQPPNVEPEAQALARRWRQAAAARRWDEALTAARQLSRQAPWAPEYEEAVASIYERLGWEPLGAVWRLRAARTRELAADQTLQQRLADLTR